LETLQPLLKQDSIFPPTSPTPVEFLVANDNRPDKQSVG